jgi:glycosyltransferase involved in cell wall biosynthesis
MNVVMISYYYLPEYSGAAKQMGRLIDQLAPFGVKFTVVSAQLDPDWALSERIGNTRIIRIPPGRKRSILSFWRGIATTLFALRSETDLVLLNGLKPAHGFAAWIAHRLKIPSIGRLSIAESDISFQQQGRLFGRLNFWFLSHADHFIAISSVLKKELVRQGLSAERCHTIVNGVDTRLFPPVSGSSRSASRGKIGIGDEIVILFVGVIDYRKGVDILLQAFQPIATRYPKTKLLLVGPKNRDDAKAGYYGKIKSLVVDLAIGDRVDFRPYADDVAAYYHAADIFVLPSRQEGMANVVLEAMACGTPVIATRISGTEDIIQDDSQGVRIAVEAVAELTQAMASLIDHPEKRASMGQRAVARIESTFNLKRTAQSYYNLFCAVSHRKD